MLQTVIVILVVAAAGVFTVWRLVRILRGKDRGGCGCGCDHCPMKGDKCQRVLR